LPQTQKQTKPILLFNDECGVCRGIARWVKKWARNNSGGAIIEEPIGDDPEVLRALNPDLDIWDAYATIHLLMPDRSMKVGGEAVAEVLRSLSNTKWLAQSFSMRIFGFRPYQMMLNLGYAILADVRPLFGCESCGTPSLWLRPVAWVTKWAKTVSGERHFPRPHFTSLAVTPRQLQPATGLPPQARQL
jgi:predicted DCC family thiol-disulfide oxidoreductase YuxK